MDDDDPNSDDFFDDNSTASRGELTSRFHDEPDWPDTDDEVEEANAADDIIKVIEGDF